MNNKHNKPERDEFQAPDGQEIALWRWPQSKARPTLHWAHATGFHGRLLWDGNKVGNNRKRPLLAV
jgi:hypothetical protein